MLQIGVTIILSQTDGAAYFTVDTNAFNVPLVLPNNYGLLKAGDDSSFIPAGNNINLISMGIIMPIGFNIFPASDNTYFYQKIELYWFPRNETKYFSNEYIMPWTDYEMNINQFLPFGNNQSKDYQLYANFNIDNMPKISMLGVPKELDEMVFNVPIFVKIQASTRLVQP